MCQRFGKWQSIGLTCSRLFQVYWWAILPLAAVTILYTNTHLYYRMNYGYDFDQHFANAYYVYITGSMPPPPNTAQTYEAQQTPLYYILTAWLFKLGDAFGLNYLDTFQHFMPVIMEGMTLAWALMITVFIEKAMQRIHPMLKSLSLLIVMLFPATIEMSGMYNDDLPAIILTTLAILTIWYMQRSGRQLEWRMWLRVSCLAALATCFKNNGLILILTLAGLAACIALVYLDEQVAGGLRRSLKVAGYAAIGMIVIFIPWAVGGWHTARYTGGDPTGVPVMFPTHRMWGTTPITFFTTFDTTIFTKPFADSFIPTGPGTHSFWSLQYVSLHSDYYNHWSSPVYLNWSPDSLIDLHRRNALPLTQYVSAVVLQYLAIPVTAIIIFGFAVSLWRVFRWPRQAMRDGSQGIAIMAVCAEAGQFWYYANHADLGIVPIHVRFLLFMVIVLFIIGMMWIGKLLRGWHPALRYVAMASLMLCLLAYAAVSYQMMWLPSI